MSTKPPFLKDSSSAASAPKDPFADRPQKMGEMEDDGSDNDNFPNRPQPMGAPKGNPESIPQGGNLPYPGPPPAPKLPFKLGK